MTTEDAKTYLAKNKIPALFESLMTGLMYHRPKDHIKYLVECLEKVKSKGDDTVSWNSFVDIKRNNKTPLPPITPQNGKRPHSNQRSRTPKKSSSPNELGKSSSPPLPPIGTAKIDIPDVPLVLVMGGPGSGKYTQVKKLIDKFNGWVHLSMGDILRSEVAQKGSAEDKWDMIGDLVSKGEMAPEEVTSDLLIKNLKAHPKAEGFIIEGYPRDMRQLKEYDKCIGRVDLAFVLDCEEYYLSQRLLKRGAKTGRVDDNLNAISNRISFFKQNTLPVVKTYDDLGKLVIIDGDRDTDVIAYDIYSMFKATFYGKKSSKTKNNKNMAEPSPRPPSMKRSRTRSGRSRTPVQMASRQGTIHNEPTVPVGLGAANITIQDQGRQSDLPDCPIFFVAGGPGSGKWSYCKKILEKYPNFVLISIGETLRNEIAKKASNDNKWSTVGTLVEKGELAPEEIVMELLCDAIKQLKNAEAIIVEGYPRDKNQVEAFNKKIGGLKFVLLLDCEEEKMEKTLLERQKTSGRSDDNASAISSRLNSYRNSTLPVLKYYDDEDKLYVVNGDKESGEVLTHICKVIDVELFGKSAAGLNDSKEPVKEEVIEAAVVKDHTFITGDDNGNAMYTKELNKLSKGKSEEAEESDSARVRYEIERAVSVNALAEEVVQSVESQIIQESDTNKVDGKEELLPDLPPIPKHMQPAEINVKDEGRKPGLPDCPIILLAGGPGSGKGTQCKRIVDRYKNIVHLSMGDILRSEIAKKGTAEDKWDMIGALVQKGEMAPEEVTVELIVNSIKEHSDAKAIIIEGYPRDSKQVEEFNKNIGGCSFVLLLDTEEYYMQTRLLNRGQATGRVDDNLNAIQSRLTFYKHNTLPVLKYFDDQQKLVVINGDRDTDVIFFDICTLLDFALYGKQPKASQAKSSNNRGIDMNSAEVDLAAKRIQAGFRGYKTRKDMKEKKDTSKKSSRDTGERDRAANKIQASFRGHKTRQEKVNKKKDTSKKSSRDTGEHDRAVKTIQASFKGHKTRQEKSNKKKDTSKKSTRDSSERDHASKTIQASFRGHKTRQEKSIKKKAASEPQNKSSEKEDAKKKVQAGFKGKQLRDSKKSRSKSPGSPKKSSDKDAAAKKIQAGFKGKQLRDNRKEPRHKFSKNHENSKAWFKNNIRDEHHHISTISVLRQ